MKAIIDLTLLLIDKSINITVQNGRLIVSNRTKNKVFSEKK